MPAVQYILFPFEAVNYNYFNGRPKKLEDKVIPDSLVSLKIAKKHVDTQEMKDRIIKEALEALTHYYAANAGSLTFPELCISTGVILRKFKKGITNGSYRKSV